MRVKTLLALMLAVTSSSLQALSPPPPPPPLAKLRFLLGNWDIRQGKWDKMQARILNVSETFSGRSSVTGEADGGGILARDDLTTSSIYSNTQRVYSFITLFYSRNYEELDAIRPQPYNSVHYYSRVLRSADQATSGNPIVFTSDGPGQAVYRLQYDPLNSDTINVSLSGRYTNNGEFHQLGSWTMIKRH